MDRLRYFYTFENDKKKTATIVMPSQKGVAGVAGFSMGVAKLLYGQDRNR